MTASHPPTPAVPPLPRWRFWGHLIWCSLGRRGAFLAWLGFLDFVIGWSLLTPTAIPTGRVLQSYAFALRLTGGRWWPLAIPWLAVGLVDLVQAFWRRDMAAFAASIGLKLWWAFLLGASWLVYGAYRGWVNTIIWVTFAAVVSIISGWPESPVLLTRCARYNYRCPRARAEKARQLAEELERHRGQAS